MSPYTNDYPRTCRICGERAWHYDLIKYGTRAYAHARCFATTKTIKDLASLPEHQRQKLWAHLEAARGRATR